MEGGGRDRLNVGAEEIRINLPQYIETSVRGNIPWHVLCVKRVNDTKNRAKSSTTDA